METSSYDLTSVDLADISRDKVKHVERVQGQVVRAKALLPEQVDPEVKKILDLVCRNLGLIKEACRNEGRRCLFVCNFWPLHSYGLLTGRVGGGVFKIVTVTRVTINATRVVHVCQSIFTSHLLCTI